MDYMQMVTKAIREGKLSADGNTWSPLTQGISAKPPGEGWTITGYKTENVPRVGKAAEGGLYSKVQVPIYTRLQAPAPAPPPPPAPAPPRVEPVNPQPLVQATNQSSGFESQIADVLKEIASNKTPMPDMSSLKIASGTNVTGNATGFARKESRARKSGQVTQGTSRVRINRLPTAAPSARVNIGV